MLQMSSEVTADVKSELGASAIISLLDQVLSLVRLMHLIRNRVMSKMHYHPRSANTDLGADTEGLLVTA